MSKMKQKSADPQQSSKLVNEAAEMIVMEQMVKTMAMDSEFQKSAMEAMSDPAVKKVHEDAETIAHDPEQMKKIQQMVMSDPKKMEMVVKHAMMMVMMHDKMDMDGGKMHDKMDQK